MVVKLPEKYSGKFKNCSISRMLCVRLKVSQIPEKKNSGTEICEYALQGCPVFQKFREILCYLHCKVPKIQTGIFGRENRTLSVVYAIHKSDKFS